VRQAVACALNQSLPPREVIVVDNGRDAPRLADFSQNVMVHRIVYRAGVAQARNAGAALASGDYVAFLDDDDLWERDYLRKVSEVIEAQAPDYLICRLDKMVGDTIVKYKNAAGKLKTDALLVRNPGVGGQNVVVRRTAFLEVSGFDPGLRTGEDKALAMEFLLRQYKIVTAPHIQAIKREHENGRLTDAEPLALGISQFLGKYGHLMTLAQRNFNRLKISQYRYLVFRRKSELMRYWGYLLVDRLCTISGGWSRGVKTGSKSL
jgi:glycosyltransferase involved in cell wall biosynthesis